MSGDYDPLDCASFEDRLSGKGEAATRPAKLDHTKFDIFGNPLSEEELRVRSDPDHWFNDLEDNRRLVEEDREMMAGLRSEEVWEAARRMEAAGQTTVTINGREYPAGTVADLERIHAQAAERARNGPVTYPGDDIDEAIRKWEYTGQKTITIDGQEYPAATRADMERLYAMAREQEQAPRDASRQSG